jgi:membrane protease YdiL (CAAX protease family)
MRWVAKITEGKAVKFPALDLLEMVFFLLFLAFMVYCDPFGITNSIIGFIKLRCPAMIRDPRSVIYAAAYVGGAAVKGLALVCLFVFLWIKGNDLKKVFALNMGRPRVWLIWSLPFILLSAAVRLLYAGDPMVRGLPFDSVFPESAALGSIVIILSALVAAPVIEEFIFRGYLYDVLKRGLGVATSIAATSMIFALAHAHQPNFSAGDLFVVLGYGAMLGIARHKTGSIAAPVLFHFLYGAVYMFVGMAVFYFAGY